MSQKDGTGRALVDHWGWAAKKGLMNKNTAGALRAACSQVLAVEDNWEALDVRTLDVEDLFRRFENLRKQDFTPQSLAAYKARFRKAVESYLDYLDDPRGWKPETRERTSSTKVQPHARGKEKAEEAVTSIEAGMITYPFPVRQGVIARLTLPRDLRRPEAKRLAAFIESVSIDPTPELPQGES